MILMIYLVLAAVLLLVVYELYWKRRHLPPGPIPMPLIGGLPNSKLDLRLEMTRYRQKYGDVFTYWLMRDPIICIADYELIKEMFVKAGDNYADRPYNLLSELQTGGSNTYSVHASSKYSFMIFI